MRMSELPAKLATALAKAQAEIKPVAKSGFNPHFKKSYSTLSDVWDAIREPLTKNGLSVLQMTSVNNNGIVMNTVLMHSSGEYVQGEMPVAPVGVTPQALGSAISYVRRYSLLSTVGGSADDDDDGEVASAPRAMATTGMGMVTPAKIATPAPTSPPPAVERVDTVKMMPKATGGGWTLAYKTAETFAKTFKDKVVKCPDLKSYEKLFTDNDENIMRLLDENPNLHDEVINITNQRKEALTSKETI